VPLLSEIEFASFLAYSPYGQSEIDRKSLRVRDGVKHDREGIIALAAQRMRARWSELDMKMFLGPDVLLVPAPRSAPLASPQDLWPSLRICEELIAHGFGAGILPCLERHTPVPKAAFAAPGERPKAQHHFETMRVAGSLLVPDHRLILAVDDFVTTGGMLLASVSLLADRFPGSNVAAFGLVRRVDSVSEIIAPCVGRITRDAVSGTTRRVP
jgi:hypothetical protein